MKYSYAKVYTGFMLVMFFGLLLPLIFTKGDYVSGMFIYYLVGIYSVFRLATIVLGGKLKLLEVTFFVFVYVFLSMVPLLQVLHNTFPWIGSYDASQIFFAGLMIALGLVGYEIGIYKGNQKVESAIKVKELKIRLLPLFIFGILSFLVATAGLGGISNLFLPRNELTLAIATNDSTSNLILNSLLRTPVFIALLYALYTWVYRKQKGFTKRNATVLLMILGLFLITAVASNPISTSRYWVGTIYLSVVFVVLRWKKMTQSLLIVGMLLLILVIFPYADVFRNAIEFNVEIESVSETFTQNGDFDAFQQFLNVQMYSEANGLTYGKQLLGVALFWVPRSVWPDKPIGTGATTSEFLGYNFTNVSAPLWVEFYINFGLIGIFLLFIVYGWASAKMQNKFNAAREARKITFYQIFVPIFAVYQIFLLRGDLLSSVSNMAPVVIFTIIGLKLAKRERKNRRKLVISRAQ
ncbi:O-antigen polymerase [uncultured Planococcus sp.]|uniref:O-antigen polymerase n=1 Tax=uncultured Planococcus sp. TaxID=337815 RepID=UPI002632E82B|nr:O-antigen polymerase [uncultured Planococcus sp.]